MTAPNVRAGNREQEIAYISRSLKELGKELDLAVIALSQLSREVEKRGTDKRPQLSDLRESGAIEQDADLVAFLYRPEVYNIEVTENGRSTRGLGEVILGKQRNGPIGSVEVQFEGHYARFSEMPESGSPGGRFVPYVPSGSGGGGSASPIPPYDADPNDSPAQKFKKFSSRMNDDTLEGSFDPGPAPF
jgi:replicative DNA helicase